MMTFRKFAAIACTVAVAGTFISCNSLDDDDLGITEQTITLTVVPQGTFTAVAPAENTESSQWKTFSGATYVLKFDFKTQKCDITVSGLKYIDEQTSQTFTLSNIP